MEGQSEAQLWESCRKSVHVKCWQSSSVPSDHRESVLLLGRSCVWGSLNRFELQQLCSNFSLYVCEIYIGKFSLSSLCHTGLWYSCNFCYQGESKVIVLVELEAETVEKNKGRAEFEIESCMVCSLLYCNMLCSE